MKKYDYIILGAGLSGLYAGYLLAKQGKDFLILEAKDHIGGRAVSDNGIELGATWYWADMQPDFARLIEQLGVSTFDDDESGDIIFEQRYGEVRRMQGGIYGSVPAKRFTRGVSDLHHTLAKHFSAGQLMLNSAVQKVVYEDDHISVHTANQQFYAEQVFIALPPRLAASQIQFAPELPLALKNEWLNTETWMAPHAKYIATFDRPFWKEEGLSGLARSGVGPMVEIHDISAPNGEVALFGFIGVPYLSRSKVSEEQLKALCKAQFVRLFGEQANNPVREILKDWAADPFTATKADHNASGQHAVPPAITASEGVWQHRIVGIGSEFSLNFSGYLAGSIEAVERVIKEKK